MEELEEEDKTFTTESLGDIESSDHHLKDDTEDQNMSELAQKRKDLGEYSLLHFACSTGDPDIFDFVHERCLDL